MAASVPSASRTSSAGSIGNTASGKPAAAQTVTKRKRPRSTITRNEVACAKGGTPPMA